MLGSLNFFASIEQSQNKGSKYYILKNNTIMLAYIETYTPAVPDIDKIYTQLDGVLKSYIVPTDKIKQVTPTDLQDTNTETKS